MANYTSFDGETKNCVTFEQFLILKNYKRKSIKEHLSRIQRLGEFSYNSVLQSIQHLLRTRAEATANRYLCSYKAYGRYLVYSEQATADELSWLSKFRHYKEVPRQRVVFSEYELKAFLECDDYYNEYFDLLAHTGARPSELATLEKRDINFANNTIAIQQSKTGDGRTIPIPEHLADDLYAFLASNASKWAFPIKNHDERHITIESIRKAFRRRQNKTRINKQLSPYCLRHTFITRMLASGADLFVVQSIVGHKQANTTQGYMHTNLLMQKQAMKKDPLVWQFLPPKQKLKMVLDYILSLGLDCDELFELETKSDQLLLRVV